jgi:hypothetical protein
VVFVADDDRLAPIAPSRMRGSPPSSPQPAARLRCCSGQLRPGATLPRGLRRCSTPGSPLIAPTSSSGRGSGAALISTPSCTRSVRRWRAAYSPLACARKLARRWRRYVRACSSCAQRRGVPVSRRCRWPWSPPTFE